MHLHMHPPLVPSSIPCRAAEGRDQPSARRISSLGPVIEGGQPAPSLGDAGRSIWERPVGTNPAAWEPYAGRNATSGIIDVPRGTCASRGGRSTTIMIASAWSTRYENRQTPQQSNENRLILLPIRQAISSVGPHHPCSWLGPAACAASFFLEG